MDLPEKTYQALIDQMEKTLVESLVVATNEAEWQAAYNRYRTGIARAHEIKAFLSAQKDSPG